MFYLDLSIGIWNCAINPMKPKLAKNQEKTIVRQRNVPNFAKKVRVHRNNGIDATILVSMPENTLVPISPKASLVRLCYSLYLAPIFLLYVSRMCENV